METNKIKQFIKENVTSILVFALFMMLIALSLDIYPTSTNDEYNESEQDTECIKIISDWDVFYEALDMVEQNDRDTWLKDLMAEYVPEELIKLRGSKYVQSRLENTFLEAKEYLEKKRKVLFTGTACQIAGLKK